jgi:hypothetical protein
MNVTFCIKELQIPYTFVVSAVYAMGFYVDAKAAKRMLGRDFGCLPPVALEHNQYFAERKSRSTPALPLALVPSTITKF